MSDLYTPHPMHDGFVDWDDFVHVDEPCNDNPQDCGCGFLCCCDQCQGACIHTAFPDDDPDPEPRHGWESVVADRHESDRPLAADDPFGVW